jgi:hypothetical protein
MQKQKAPQIIDLQGLKFRGAERTSIEHVAALFLIINKLNSINLNIKITNVVTKAARLLFKIVHLNHGTYPPCN